MGLYDYVNVKMPCPYCGHILINFQTKDAYNTLITVEPDEVSSFYTNCPICRKWIEFYRPSSQPEVDKTNSKTREEVEALGFVLKEE